jgi:hypothetical protein
MATLNTVCVVLKGDDLPEVYKPILDAKCDSYRLNVASEYQLAVLNDRHLLKYPIECITIEHDYFTSHITYYLNITYSTDINEYDRDLNNFRYRVTYNKKIPWDTVLFNSYTSPYMLLHKRFLLLNIAMLHNYGYLDSERTSIMRMYNEREHLFNKEAVERNIIQTRAIHRIMSKLTLPELADIIHTYYTNIPLHLLDHESDMDM